MPISVLLFFIVSAVRQARLSIDVLTGMRAHGATCKCARAVFVSKACAKLLLACAQRAPTAALVDSAYSQVNYPHVVAFIEGVGREVIGFTIYADCGGLVFFVLFAVRKQLIYLKLHKL